VSSRASKLVILGGFAVVLAMGVVLIVLTRSTTAASDQPPPPAPGAHTPVATTAPTAPIVTATPADAAPAPASGRIAPTRSPTLAPAVEMTRRDVPRDENGHIVPIINVRELRAQMGRTDGPMKACVAKAAGAATGKATLTFTVAAKDHKLVVESTGVQDEETLAAYPELLECMHQTATALQPVLDQNAPANLGTAIYVRRHVRLDNGALAENSIFDFSYVP